MKKKAEKLITYWTARLGLPNLTVNIVNENECEVSMKACIDCEHHLIIINKDRINCNEDLIFSVIHELCHLWYFYRFLDDRYLSEKRVINLTYKLLQKAFPKVYEYAINYGLEFTADWTMRDTNAEHYYGYLNALQRYGVITYHVKKC